MTYPALATIAIAACALAQLQPAPDTAPKPYLDYVTGCVDLLMERGTDRYGERHAPILVSILDVESQGCPQHPEPSDEAWRVTRRERRNPAGANLLTDQPLLKTMRYLSAAAGDAKYERFARTYMDYWMEHLVDKKGLLWWGWHRHYDVFTDSMEGHQGNHHEIHAIHGIDWDTLWEVNPSAVRLEIEACWKWHVINKDTGEINRHADGKPGCDFSMSAGSFIDAFCFLAAKTGEEFWLERAKLLANYYWDRRDPATNLIAERPNAGRDRFDGGSFVTSVTGCLCHALLKCYERTGDALFRDHALAYLKAYANLGYDPDTGTYWGALKLDGTPIPGPRILEGYAQYEPRGHLDLWEPYAAGYQFAIYTAQAYAYAYALTKDAQMLRAAKRFAAWIEKQPPAEGCMEESWYKGYATGFAPQGAHAGKYGRTISFYLHLFLVTEQQKYLNHARAFADESIAKLHHRGLFRGHPAKPYYESMDGVGYLLYALLELHQVLEDPEEALARKSVPLPGPERSMPSDNW